MQRSLSLQKIGYFLEDISVGDIASGVVETRRVDKRHGKAGFVVVPQRSTDVDCLGVEVMANANVIVFGEKVDELSTRKGEYSHREAF